MNKITGFLLTTGFRKFRHMLRKETAKAEKTLIQEPDLDRFLYCP